MPKQTIIQVIILSVTFIAYLVFTIRYFIFLRRDNFYSKGIKTIHFVLIWLIPFVWIILLKALAKRTPGSHEIEKKEEPQPFSKTGRTPWG